MFKFIAVALLALVAAAPTPVEEPVVEADHGRELFPLYAIGTKCARRGCSKAATAPT